MYRLNLSCLSEGLDPLDEEQVKSALDTLI